MVDIKHNSARRPLAMLLLSLLFVASGCNTLFNRGRQPTDFSEDQGWRPLGWKDNKSRKVDTEQQDDEPESSRRRSSRRQADRTQDKERSGEKQTSDSDRNEKKQDLVNQLKTKTPKEFARQMAETDGDNAFVANMMAIQAQALKDHNENPPERERRDSAFKERTPKNSLRGSESSNRRPSSRRRRQEPRTIDVPLDVRALQNDSRDDRDRARDDRDRDADTSDQGPIRRSLEDNSHRRNQLRQSNHNEDRDDRRRDRATSRRDDRDRRSPSSHARDDQDRNTSRRERNWQADKRDRNRDDASARPKKRNYQWRELLNQSIAELQDKLRDKELDKKEAARMEVALRLMSVAAGHKEDALATIKGMPEPWQEFWKNLSHGMFVSMDAASDPIGHRHAARALRPIRTAKHHLAALSSLDVRNASFCKKVIGYGEFTPFVPTRFKADQEVLLYIEVENFVASKTAKGYETELSGVYQILDESGQRIAEYELPVDKQHCRNLRRDYFIAYRMHMPKKIAEGSYKLQLTIHDAKGKKYGHATLPFEIAKR